MKKGLIEKLDLSSIIFPILIIVVICFGVFFVPDLLNSIMSFINMNFGNQITIFNYISCFALFLVLLFLAFSKYGQIVLGDKNEKAQLPFWSWGAMMFCCGVAADLIYYSCTDWLALYQDKYVNSLPDAFNFSVVNATYLWTYFWFYFIVAICLGYFLYVKKNNNYKFGEALRPLFGNKIDGLVGKIINIIVIVILIIGVACSQCFSVPVLTSCVCELFNIPYSNAITLFFMILICSIYTISVLNGLKGIEFLSKICIYIFLVLVAYVLLFGGETTSIIGSMFKQTGMLIDKFVFLLTDFDPYRVDNYAQTYNGFWIAYWYSWAITTPFFIAIISRGKKVKDVILQGALFVLPAILIGCMVFPNYAMAKHLKGIVNFIDVYNNNTEKFSVIVSICQTLPYKYIAFFIMLISMICFTATSLDSLSLSASYFTYKKITQDEVPDKKIRLLWAIVLMLLPAFITISKMDYLIIQDMVTLIGSLGGVLIILLVISFFKDVNKNKDSVF